MSYWLCSLQKYNHLILWVQTLQSKCLHCPCTQHYWQWLYTFSLRPCTGFAERITSYRCISHKVYFTGSCTKNFSLYIHLNCKNTCNFQQNLHLIPLPPFTLFYSFLPCGVRIKCPCTCTGFELSTKCVNRCI